MEPAGSRRPERVKAMFGGIASRYDLLNHLLSANLDRLWRKKAAMALPPSRSAAVLDLCGGTGDLSLEICRRGRAGLVVCADFAHEMLRIAHRKFPEDACVPLGADGLRLPFASGTFDAVTVAFGVRNFSDLDRGLEEISRVLKKDGNLVILEFSRPVGPILGRLYKLYLNRILPRLGDRISGKSGPYGYLARTIGGFPLPDGLAERILRAGFRSCGWRRMTGGVVALHTAKK